MGWGVASISPWVVPLEALEHARAEAAEHTVRLLASGTKAILRIGYTTIAGHALVIAVVSAVGCEIEGDG